MYYDTHTHTWKKNVVSQKTVLNKGILNKCAVIKSSIVNIFIKIITSELGSDDVLCTFFFEELRIMH